MQTEQENRGRDARVAEILARPASERVREFKYRFAQSMVFGLPVIALEYLGPMLGGNERGRWAGLLQILLTSWVMYVGAAGMLVEGMMLLSRRRVTMDLLVALLAVAVYLFSIAMWVLILMGRQLPLGNPAFHVCVMILIVWTGLRLLWVGRKLDASVR